MLGPKEEKKKMKRKRRQDAMLRVTEGERERKEELTC